MCSSIDRQTRKNTQQMCAALSDEPGFPLVLHFLGISSEPGRGCVTPHSLIFRDIAMVFAASLLCGLIAWRLRQPILLGYVLAGLLLSPLTPGPHVQDVPPSTAGGDRGRTADVFGGYRVFHLRSPSREMGSAGGRAANFAVHWIGRESERCFTGRSRKESPWAASFPLPAPWF
jgi:hypothetical protein